VEEAICYVPLVASYGVPKRDPLQPPEAYHDPGMATRDVWRRVIKKLAPSDNEYYVYFY